MNRPCKGSVPRLIALMDGSLRPSAADKLRSHLQGCPGCSEAHRRLVETKRLCREMDHQEPPELSWRRIEAQIHWKTARREEERPSRGGRFTLPALALGAAAAGAVIAVIVMGQINDAGRPVPADTPRAPVARSEAPQDEELAAVPTLIRGDVNVVDTSGSLEPLTLDRPLLQGAGITTGDGRTTLQWAAGSGTTIAQQSVVELARLRTRGQQLQLRQGKVYVKLAKLAPGQSFEVVAGGIRTSVRGTHFSVELGQETVDVEVFEGLVHVAPLDQRWVGIDVPEEHRVSVRIDGTRPTLQQLDHHGPLASTMNLIPWPSFPRVMAGTSLLSLASKPAGADLKLNNRMIGATDLRLRTPLGRHLVELWHGGKLLEKRWIEVKPQPAAVSMDIREHMIRIRPRTVRLSRTLYQFIRHRTPQIRACYDRWLKRNPDLKGRLIFRINVDADGTVSETSLIRDTFAEPKVGMCALHVIKRWRFPQRKEAETLVYPFNFRSASTE
jgi:ferric-dicitrate binding protein FerR (iron transport regulator)